MKKTIQFYLYLVLCAFWAISCSENSKEAHYQISPGHWGHLAGLSDTLPSKMYLSHVKKDESYKICIAKYMVKKYPGIESEIKAAINIWGHYISRVIKVEFARTDLPVADEYSDENKVMEDYYSRCPKDIHLVVGQSHFTDDAVGKTLHTFSYFRRPGRKEVSSYKRALFLRESVTAEEAQKEDEAKDYTPKLVWKSLAQIMGKELTDTEILELMKKRGEKLYLTGNHELLTFKTIVHEFGHIWGLCDQYALGGKETNCDGKFATINKEGHIILHDEAMMSKSSWVAKLFLEDDDIEGIRKLAERKEFTHDWPAAPVFRATEVIKPVAGKPIALARIKSVTFEDLTVELNMSMVTNVAPLTITARIFDKNSGSWLEFGEVSHSKAVTLRSYVLELNVDRYIIPEKVKLTLAYEEKTPSVAASPEQDEAPAKKVSVELESAVTIIEKPVIRNKTEVIIIGGDETSGDDETTDEGEIILEDDSTDEYL